MSNIYIQEPPTDGKVLIKSSAGDFDIELWSKEAPKACRNFVQLCLEGYYNGTIFHRVVPGFIAQGGDPTGTGTGGESIYGKTFKDEFHTRLRFVRRGLVAMANAGPNDNGSQFFFTLGNCLELQNKHTIFGKVAGDTLYNLPRFDEGVFDKDDRPEFPHKIIKTEILKNPFNDIIPRAKIENEIPKHERKKKKGTKNFSLLSFGDEAFEDEEASVQADSTLPNRGKSAHDIAKDPNLSKEAVSVEEKSKDDVLKSIQEKLKKKESFSTGDDGITDADIHIKSPKEKSIHIERERRHSHSKSSSISGKRRQSSEHKSEGEKEHISSDHRRRYSRDVKENEHSDDDPRHKSKSDFKQRSRDEERHRKDPHKKDRNKDSTIPREKSGHKEWRNSDYEKKQSLSENTDKPCKENEENNLNPKSSKRIIDTDEKHGMKKLKLDDKKGGGNMIPRSDAKAELNCKGEFGGRERYKGKPDSGLVKNGDKDDNSEEKPKKNEKSNLKAEINKLKRELTGKDNPREKHVSDPVKNEEKISISVEEYHQVTEKYKDRKQKYAAKGKARDLQTLEFLKKFTNKIKNLPSNEEKGDRKEESEDKDINDDSWFNFNLVFDGSEPILAKDASTKDDHWYDINDPRNALNKRRRDEPSKKYSKR